MQDLLITVQDRHFVQGEKKNSNMRNTTLRRSSVAVALTMLAMLMALIAGLPTTVNAQALSDDATIRILADGNEIDGFLPHQRLNTYDAPTNAASVTLTISTVNQSAKITRIIPADADIGTEGHQVSIDTSLVEDNTLVQTDVTAEDGTQRTNYLMVRGFSCHNDLGLGRVAPQGRTCIILRMVSVKVSNEHTMDYATEQLNNRAGWRVTYSSPSIRWLFATRNPDNLSLAQLQQEAQGIKALPWASRIELQSTVEADGEATDGQGGDDETAEPLTGAFDASTVPSSHDGSAAFTFEIHFSEEPALSFRNVMDHVLTVTDGHTTAVRRTDPQGQYPNMRWEITVTPSDDDDLIITLPPTTNCDTNSAVCTASGKLLSNRSFITIAGPTPTVIPTPAPTPIVTSTPPRTTQRNSSTTEQAGGSHTVLHPYAGSLQPATLTISHWPSCSRKRRESRLYPGHPELSFSPQSKRMAKLLTVRVATTKPPNLSPGHSTPAPCPQVTTGQQPSRSRSTSARSRPSASGM